MGTYLVGSCGLRWAYRFSAMAYAVRTQKDYDQLAKSKRNAAKHR